MRATPSHSPHTVAKTHPAASGKPNGDTSGDTEMTYRMMFEQNPHCMWIFDLHTLEFLAVNNAAIAHYGYSREEFLSMTIADIRPPEDIPKLQANLAREVHGLDDAGVWRHLRKDGSIIHVEIAAYRTEFGGRSAEIVMAIDVTARIHAEEQILTQLQELRRWQSVTLRREARIHALKLEVNALLREAGRPIRYAESDIALDEALHSPRFS